MTSLLSDITARLSSISETPSLDSSVLIGHIVNRPRTWVVSHPEITLTSGQQRRLNNSLSRLEGGEPLPYILGHWEFFGLDLKVTSDVLIPRPETELLVERAIAWLKEHPQRRMVADVGTGSGAIAISIAANVPEAIILATDISAKALKVAKHNAEKHRVNNRVNFIECDLFPRPTSVDVGKTKIDLLCANLPYIPTKTLQSLSVYKREPTLALDGGVDGFDIIRRLMRISPNYLASKASMLFEIEATLGEQALKLAENMFPVGKIHLYQDLSNHDRLLEIELP